MTKVKIIIINTWKCDGAYHNRMRILARQLEALQPDIIACQECFSSADTDTLKFLADELKMNHMFTPGRNKSRFFDGKWVHSQSGLGILSAYPINIVEELVLPATMGDEDRKAQIAEILLPGGKKILVANIHLTHLKNTDLRKEQALTVAKKVKSIDGFDYKMICGDFNAQTNSEEITAFVNEANAIDCYTAGNGAEPRTTLFETLGIKRHISVDHVFAVPLPNAVNIPHFEEASVVLNQPDIESGIYPSDHFGISVTLRCD